MPLLRVGAPLWVASGGVPPAAMRSGVVLRALRGDGADGDRLALVGDWVEGTAPAGADAIRTEVTSVRLKTRVSDDDEVLAIDGPLLLVTTMRIGDVPAEDLLRRLHVATDHFLPDSPAVTGVAFARSRDGRWVVEVLAATSVAAMRRVQQDPAMQHHIREIGAATGEMRPALCRVERVVGPVGGTDRRSGAGRREPVSRAQPPA